METKDQELKSMVIENPIQERHIDRVGQSFEETAEAVLSARRLEVREETGLASALLFVP